MPGKPSVRGLLSLGAMLVLSQGDVLFGEVQDSNSWQNPLMVLAKFA